ncbi:MAG: uncharacterized membrane protein YebE (DUF533 family) [Arenicella sp.]|jgi:uncharacterized membrane protein YebE (DUF533 family)
MNLQNILNSLSQNVGQAEQSATPQNKQQSASPASGLSSLIPGGLMGGAAAGGVMALLLGSKSTRKMAKKVATLGGTAVLGGLAYKAYGNWQQNKAIGQTQAVTDQDIQLATQAQPVVNNLSSEAAQSVLTMTLIKTMVAASKADGNIDTVEHKRLFDAIEGAQLSASDKGAVFDLMARDIPIQEIANAVIQDEHKAEVYLAGYLAIEVDNQAERTFLNNLAIALDLPRGLPAYLEQQADQGVTA